MPVGLPLTVPEPVPDSPIFSVKVGIVLPVPESATDCMLPDTPFELSVNMSEAISLLVVVGVKMTKTVHDAPAASVPPCELHVSPGPSVKSLPFVPKNP
jgi:hypothetical protein